MAKNNQPRILAVDDEKNMRFFISSAMETEGYHADVADNALEALDKIKKAKFDAVIMDIKMPRMSGIEALSEIMKIDSQLPVIMLTVYSSDGVAMEAIKRGAYDYLTKPCKIDELRIVVRRAIEKRRLQKQIKLLEEQLKRRREFPNIIGKSGRMQEVFELVSKVLDNDVTVLIYGESGTGKELIAEAIHYNSLRKEKPFVKLNCAAIPENLLESELFGHEKGAFTSATSMKPGKFELADEGTLFLDEIGDMSLASQMKILRVLQEEEFERVGGTTPIKVDVRIIAATNKDLEQSVREKEFREDLYYRLNVFPILLPPLRERKEDIPLLVEHFIESFNAEFNKQIKRISDEAMNLLMNYRWPGNVRELENAIERAIVFAEGNIITEQHLPLTLQSIGEKVQAEIAAMDDFLPLTEKIKAVTTDIEKELIIDALNKTNWKRKETAQLLKISRKTLYNKMEEYYINR